MLQSCLRRLRLQSLPPYLISLRQMSSSPAYIVPYDHQSSNEIAPGLDAGQLWATTPAADKPAKVGTVRTFYNTPQAKVTSVTSLGEKFSSQKDDERRELLRKAVGSAVKELKAIDGVKDVSVDASVDPHAAGMHLFASYG